ncbi:MAG TPA: DUF4328 domain-containing protein [Candidatus Solibacter sp.]|nr:DUF4328 domain-containing protein [Candidatus Solibacter sp.]
MKTGRDLSPLLEASAGGRRPPYASLTRLSRVAVLALVLAAGMLVYQAYISTLTVFGLAVLALASAVSLAWLYRAYRNLAALGAGETRDSPASAVAWFLVPVANWFLTYLVLRDLWELSDRSDPHGLDVGRPLLVAVWWFFWAAPAFASVVSLLFFERPGPGTAATRAQALISFDLGCLAVAALLAAVIIVRVSSRQEAGLRLAEAANAGI